MLMHLLKDHFALDNDNKEPESSERKKKKKKRDHESVLDSQTAESTTLASTSAISSDSEISSYLTNNSINIDYGTKEVPNELKPILQFPSLFSRIPSQLHAALSKFNEPTPIQACSWPALLAGRDVVGIAETGRYVLPLLIDYTLLLIHSSKVERHLLLEYPLWLVSSNQNHLKNRRKHLYSYSLPPES